MLRTSVREAKVNVYTPVMWTSRYQIIRQRQTNLYLTPAIWDVQASDRAYKKKSECFHLGDMDRHQIIQSVAKCFRLAGGVVGDRWHLKYSMLNDGGASHQGNLCLSLQNSARFYWGLPTPRSSLVKDHGGGGGGIGGARLSRHFWWVSCWFFFSFLPSFFP